MEPRFDAISYAQELETAGVPKAQAEVHARTLAQVQSECMARSTDLTILKRELEGRISESEIELGAQISKSTSQLRSEIAAVKSRLLTEIAAVESRLRIEIASVEASLAAKIDTAIAAVRADLGAEIRLVKWMNALTLALVVGLLLKTWPT
jgi:hypothetical protein